MFDIVVAEEGVEEFLDHFFVSLSSFYVFRFEWQLQSVFEGGNCGLVLCGFLGFVVFVLLGFEGLVIFFKMGGSL